MTDLDPDLKSIEGNRPVAIDKVDSNLVVKRYDGTEESFPLGGGGWETNSPILFLNCETPFNVPTWPNQSDSVVWEHATLGDGDEQEVTEGLVLSDDYSFLDTSALLINTPGLYLINAAGEFESETEDGIGFRRIVVQNFSIPPSAQVEVEGIAGTPTPEILSLYPLVVAGYPPRVSFQQNSGVTKQITHTWFTVQKVIS